MLAKLMLPLPLPVTDPEGLRSGALTAVGLNYLNLVNIFLSLLPKISSP